MTQPGLTILLLIFTIHLVVFSRLAIKYKKDYQRMGALTFALLVLGYMLRIRWPDIQLGGHSIHTYLRGAAWVTSGWTLLLFLQQKFRDR